MALYHTLEQVTPLKDKKIRLLGVDYGDRNVGLALSDLSWTLTRALPIFDVKKGNIFPYIRELIRLENIGAIIMGYPMHMDGQTSELCQKTHHFCQKLNAGIPIVRFDERMTSMMAERYMLRDDISRQKRKEKLDSIAACFILQGALDRITVISTEAKKKTGSLGCARDNRGSDAPDDKQKRHLDRSGETQHNQDFSTSLEIGTREVP